MVLRNTGRVGFTFEILQLPVEEEEEEEKSEAEEEEEEEGKEEGKEEGAVNDDASEDVDQEKSPEEERECEEGEGEEKEREEVEREKSQEFKEPAVEAPKDDVREIRPGQPMVIPRMVRMSESKGQRSPLSVVEVFKRCLCVFVRATSRPVLNKRCGSSTSLVSRRFLRNRSPCRWRSCLLRTSP